MEDFGTLLRAALRIADHVQQRLPVAVENTVAAAQEQDPAKRAELYAEAASGYESGVADLVPYRASVSECSHIPLPSPWPRAEAATM